MNDTVTKGNAAALLPIGVFLLIFLGAGIAFGDFYAMPAVVAFLIALFMAFMQNRQQKFADKIKVIAKGVGEENIITMSLIFSLCGWIFRCGNSSRRSGKHSEPGTFSDTDPLCGGRTFRDRLFYFSFYGNIHGNDRRTCTDRSGNQRKDRI